MVQEIEGTFKAGDADLYTKSWLVSFCDLVMASQVITL